MSVTMQLGAVTEKLTRCQMKPSGSCQSPCSSDRSRRNSLAVESSHRAHVSRHVARSGHGETHKLSNQAIRLMSVTMQLGAVTEKLTCCRIKPSGSSQSPYSSDRSRRNPLAVDSSHRAHVSHHAARSGHGDSPAVESSHRAHVSHHVAQSSHGHTHTL